MKIYCPECLGIHRKRPDHCVYLANEMLPRLIVEGSYHLYPIQRIAYEKAMSQARDRSNKMEEYLRANSWPLQNICSLIPQLVCSQRMER